MTDRERERLLEEIAKAICRIRHKCDPETPMPIMEKDASGPPIWTCYKRYAEAALMIVEGSDLLDSVMCKKAANEIEQLVAEVARIKTNYREENASAQRQWKRRERSHAGAY